MPPSLLHKVIMPPPLLSTGDYASALALPGDYASALGLSGDYASAFGLPGDHASGLAFNRLFYLFLCFRHVILLLPLSASPGKFSSALSGEVILIGGTKRLIKKYVILDN